MRVWTPNFDMSSIPDEVFKSEVGRRNALKRTSYSGGVLWAKHNPETARCRCARCINKRNKKREEAAAQPKRPRGRPRTIATD